MLKLENNQAMMWLIFQNLRHDSAAFSPTPDDPTNFSQELLTGFLNNDIFYDTVSSIAASMGRNDITSEITSTSAQPSVREDMANGLMIAVERGDEDMLVDLVKDPENPILSLENLNNFWNADVQISQEDPDLHTHIQADLRYVQNFDAYISANEISGKKIVDLRADIVAQHQAASKILDSMEYDGIQMALHASANQFYDLSSKGDVETLGYNNIANKTIFSGLKVSEPLQVAELQRVTAELPSDTHQRHKNLSVATRELADENQVAYEDNAGILQAHWGKENPPTAPLIAGNSFIASSAAAATRTYKPEINIENGDIAYASAVTRGNTPDENADVVNSSIPVSLRQHFSDMTGAQYLAQKAIVDAERTIETKEPAPTEYDVQKGDNLWKIAKNEYGLKSYKDIMKAVDHIAHANGMEKGTDANWVNEGAKIKIPSAEAIKGPIGSLDWKALADDPKLGNSSPAAAFAN